MSSLKQLLDSLEHLPARELEHLYQRIRERRHALAQNYHQLKYPAAHRPDSVLSPEEVDATIAAIIHDADYDASHK